MTRSTPNSSPQSLLHSFPTYLLIAWISLLTILTFSYGKWLDLQHNPNHPPASKLLRTGEKQVTLLLNRYDHYISSGTINGHDVNFLLDTGSTHVALSKSLADQLGLQIGEVTQTETANGMIETYQTMIDKLQIGNIQLKHVSASINPYMAHNDDILLGMSVLKQLDFVQKNGQLIITQPLES